MRKVRAIFRILFQDNLNFRAQAVVWILTSVVPIMTTAYVWLASFGGRANIGGFNKANILVYFLGALLLSNLVTSSIGFDVGHAIKDGSVSFYLVRPAYYPSWMFLSNLAWRVFRSILFIPFLIVLIIAYHSIFSQASLHLSATFWLAVLLAHLLSFAYSLCVGFMAFFFEDMSAFGQISFLFSFLFSGQLAPISLMPHGLKIIAQTLPFQYMMSFPLQIMVNQADQIHLNILKSFLWMAAFMVLSIVMFQVGTKRYSAIGQ